MAYFSMVITKKNKQTITRVVIVYISALFLFSLIGDRGLVASYRLWNQRQNLDREIINLKQDVQGLNEQVQKFRSDDKTLEQYAREKLNMSGDNEIQYIFR